MATADSRQHRFSVLKHLLRMLSLEVEFEVEFSIRYSIWRWMSSRMKSHLGNWVLAVISYEIDYRRGESELKDKQITTKSYYHMNFTATTPAPSPRNVAIVTPCQRETEQLFQLVIFYLFYLNQPSSKRYCEFSCNSLNTIISFSIF